MHEAPRGQVLLIGIALLVIGSILASGKSMLRQSPEDRVKRQVTATRVVGVAVAVGGVIFILAAFGVGGPVYTNCC